MAEAIRERIRDAAKPRVRKIKKKWTAPEPESFAPEPLLCWDQTLVNTGWALVSFPVVIITGMCRPEPSDLRGHELTLHRAESLGRAIDQVVFSPVGRAAVTYVHEMPALFGSRLESSLMAARELRRAASGYRVVGVYNQSMKALLVAPEKRPANRKADVKEAVLQYVDISQLPKGCPLNEHVYDAIALGLTYSHKDVQ
jgi:hypothetical protein